ncbi:MAG: hypothetical protein U0T72_10225 [Chitinophagales bacterium]
MKKIKIIIAALLAFSFAVAAISSCKGSKCDCPHGTFNGRKSR